MAEAGDETAPWVALGVYAARTGQHIDKVRAAVRRGRLPGRKGNDGHWLVRLAATEADLGHDTGVIELLAELRQRLAEAHDEIASAKAEAEHWRASGEEARLARAKAEGERDVARAVEADLREQLAWHRQPFWRRWLNR